MRDEGGCIYCINVWIVVPRGGDIEGLTPTQGLEPVAGWSTTIVKLTAAAEFHRGIGERDHVSSWPLLAVSCFVGSLNPLNSPRQQATAVSERPQYTVTNCKNVDDRHAVEDRIDSVVRATLHMHWLTINIVVRPGLSSTLNIFEAKITVV